MKSDTAVTETMSTGGDFLIIKILFRSEYSHSVKK